MGFFIMSKEKDPGFILELRHWLGSIKIKFKDNTITVTEAVINIDELSMTITPGSDHNH